MTLPKIIQGGMGAAVSNWRLANATARLGCLGVVSGTALDSVLARRLQDGDADGQMREALAHFPSQRIAGDIIQRYFNPKGREPRQPYRGPGLYSLQPAAAQTDLIIAANFVEVFLAKKGHSGVVGINLLDKIRLPNMASLYGAMLAGVDFVLMGAGIPREIPGILDRLSSHQAVSLRIPVEGDRQGVEFGFDPAQHLPECSQPLKRPTFLGIVSSLVLAKVLADNASGRVDGLVIEGSVAGGHNAPPRGNPALSEHGEPVYGQRDEVDLAQLRVLGLPFWLAGGYGTPEKLQDALQLGATGIQVGTLFAFCEESGFDRAIKRQVIDGVRSDTIQVFTDPDASPTRFPFKVIHLRGAVTDVEQYGRRRRVCNLGYLRTAYRRSDGTIGYRCPAEPEDLYVKKGGSAAETRGKICLCNGLLAAIGQPQHDSIFGEEPPLVTAGKDLSGIRRIVADGRATYDAKDVINLLLRHSVSSAR
jgi:nitronate monooxygenase